MGSSNVPAVQMDLDFCIVEAVLLKFMDGNAVCQINRQVESKKPGKIKNAHFLIFVSEAISIAIPNLDKSLDKLSKDIENKLPKANFSISELRMGFGGQKVVNFEITFKDRAWINPDLVLDIVIKFLQKQSAQQ